MSTLIEAQRAIDNLAINHFVGDAVIDGIDLDIESGSPTGYASLVNRLRQLYSADTSKTYYIGGTSCSFLTS